jgi:hypothetical protein
MALIDAILSILKLVFMSTVKDSAEKRAAEEPNNFIAKALAANGINEEIHTKRGEKP